MRHPALRALLGSALAACAAEGAAQEEQDVPVIDTEDATLGTATMDLRTIRLMGGIDVRNGDYARGAYDDDDADLRRLPVHAAIGFAALLRADRQGRGSIFLSGQSSNGFHAPGAQERRSPRSWYESNSIIALAARPRPGLTTALAYAIKVSPNGVASTTHEASLSMRYAADRGAGWWRPTFVVTRRTKGDGGVFTLLGIAPQIEAGKLSWSLPVGLGIGWSGFYGAGSGNRAYASIGAAVDRRISRRATVTAQLLGLVRDARLATLDRPRGTAARVVPVFTLGFTVR